MTSELGVSQQTTRFEVRNAILGSILLFVAVSGALGQNAGGASSANGNLGVFALTADGRLIGFRESTPQFATNFGPITGLSGDQRLVGIDFRPATGELVGLGNAGGVYTVNTQNAVATLLSQLNVTLSGTSFGVDFNPTVDRLRVVSDTGQNLRVNVATGATTVDMPLIYTSGAMGVTGAAYTNNDADPNTGTTLYDIDSLLNQVVIQAPPNNGTLNATGVLTVDTDADVGFDIYSSIANGTTVDVRALATLKVGADTQLYSIALFSGKATLRGTFTPANQVVAIAIPLNQD